VTKGAPERRKVKEWSKGSQKMVKDKTKDGQKYRGYSKERYYYVDGETRVKRRGHKEGEMQVKGVLTGGQRRVK
jgi:hypothetical protein